MTDDKLAVPAMAGWLGFRPVFAGDMLAFAEQVRGYSKSHFNITEESVDPASSAALHDAIML